MICLVKSAVHAIEGHISFGITNWVGTPGSFLYGPQRRILASRNSALGCSFCLNHYLISGAFQVLHCYHHWVGVG